MHIFPVTAWTQTLCWYSVLLKIAECEIIISGRTGDDAALPHAKLRLILPGVLIKDWRPSDWSFHNLDNDATYCLVRCRDLMACCFLPWLAKSTNGSCNLFLHVGDAGWCQGHLPLLVQWRERGVRYKQQAAMVTGSYSIAPGEISWLVKSAANFHSTVYGILQSYQVWKGRVSAIH